MAFLNPHASALTKVVSVLFTLLPTFYQRRRLTGPRQSLLVWLASIASGVDRCGVRSTRIFVLERFRDSIGWNGPVPSTSVVCRAMRKLTVSMLEPVLDRALAEVTTSFGDRALVHGRRLVSFSWDRRDLRRLYGPRSRLPAQDALRSVRVLMTRLFSTRVVLSESMRLACLRFSQDTMEGNGKPRHLGLMTWGWHRDFARDGTLFNARVEGIQHKAIFAQATATRAVNSPITRLEHDA